MFILNGIIYVVVKMDFILLEDNELQDIFDIVNDFQIIFHPYYFKEGKFEHYEEFLEDKKEKVIILDRNMTSMIFDYFSKGKLNSEFDMIMILFFLLFCNINSLQYNIGLSICEYADFKENDIAINQLNKILTYLSVIPTMVFKNKLMTGNYEFKPIDIPNGFHRHANYKIKSDLYMNSYCSILKIAEIYLSELSIKDKILTYLDWYYDRLQLSKYDITYAILLFTNYKTIKAPKNIKSKNYEKIIKGCKNQAWDIQYLSSLDNIQHNLEGKYFFATNDNNLKLIFMACNYFEHAWISLIENRMSKKDRNEIFDLIESKSKNRVKPDCSKEILTNLSIELEENIKEKVMIC